MTMPNKLIKNVSIARSGIYSYLRSEVPNLRVGPIPAQYDGVERFNVYRPAHVIADAVGLFTRQPVTVEHPSELVAPENAKILTSGFTGDSAVTEYKDGEVYINSSLTLVADDAISYYENGYKEVSPGYIAESKWLDSAMEYKGVPYHIIVTRISAVNHLALTMKARGGPTTCITDSLGGNNMKVVSGLLRWAKQQLGLVKDTDLGSVRALLNTINKENAEYVVEEVATLIGDIPESTGKETLLRFLADLKYAKDLDPAVLKTAANKTADLFEKLDAEAMKEVSEVPEQKEKDEVVADFNPGTTAAAGPGASTVKEENATKEVTATDTAADTDEKKSEVVKEPVKDSAQLLTDSIQALIGPIQELTALLKDSKKPEGSTPEDKVVVDSTVPQTITATMDSGSTGKSIDEFMSELTGKK